MNGFKGHKKRIKAYKASGRMFANSFSCGGLSELHAERQELAKQYAALGLFGHNPQSMKLFELRQIVEDATRPRSEAGTPNKETTMRAAIPTHVESTPWPTETNTVRYESFGEPDEYVTESAALACLSGHGGDEPAHAKFLRTGTACSPNGCYTRVE